MSYIWKGRCSSIFHQVRVSLVEVVRNIWLDMVHTLKGQWDYLIGYKPIKLLNVSSLLLFGKILHFCAFKDGSPFWYFQPAKVAQRLQYITLWKDTPLIYFKTSEMVVPSSNYLRIASLCKILYTNEWILYK